MRGEGVTGSGPEPQAHSQHNTQPQPGEPISLRDVLRAVFLPARGARSQPAPVAPPTKIEREPEFEPPPEAVTAPVAATVEYADEGVPAARARSPAERAASLVGAGVTLLVAFLAQTALSAQGRPTTALVLYLLAGASWLALLRFDYRAALGRGPRVTDSAARPARFNLAEVLRARAAVATGALLLSIATFALTAHNTFTLPGIAAWVTSVVLWMVVAAERSPGQLARDWADGITARLRGLRAPRLRLLPLAALLAILSVAAFFRVYRLDALPVEMTSDHVEKVLDAYSVSQGITSVFFRANGGREAIQFYLIPVAAKLFGTGFSFLTLKLVSAIEGLLLIPLMVVLGREVVDRETGFLAAAFVAVSWWHVALSRLALRIVLTPLLFTLVLLTLIRGLRTGSRRAWVWAGFWMGVGVYGYQAMRITPLVALAALVAACAGPVYRWLAAAAKKRADAPQRGQAARGVLARQGANLALAGLVALAIFVPMLRVWHDYPRDLWARVVNRTTESEVAIEGQPVEVLAGNLRDALGMFNVRGDVAWISAVPNKPLLDRVAASLLVLGVLGWAARLAVRRDPADAFLLAAGLIMLLPSALAIAFPIENPSATRASGALPIVFLLVAWPLALIRQQWRAQLGRVTGTALAGALIAAALAGSAVLSFRTYFEEYDASYRGAALNPSQVAEEVRRVIGPDAPMNGVWLQGWPHWHDYRAIGIEAGEIGFDNAILDAAMLEQSLRDHPEYFTTRPLVFIVHPDDTPALHVLEREFPSGEARRFEGYLPGRDFVLFVVPAR